METMEYTGMDMFLFQLTKFFDVAEYNAVDIETDFK